MMEDKNKEGWKPKEIDMGDYVFYCCGKCGNMIDYDDVFCSSCGSKIDWPDEEAS